jgi:hypothetical protein
VTEQLPGATAANRTVTDHPGAWRSVEFHDRVRAWVDERLEARGIRLTGEWSQPHARPWSSAIRLGSTAGPVWFKVNGAGTRHEPALLRLLADRVPALVPEVIAVSTDRGWSLTRDAGPMLREALPPSESWRAWESVVREYAAAQLELADARDAVRGAGVAEVSPATLPLLARRLVAELGKLPVGVGGLTFEDTRGLRAMLPRLDGWCAELDASPVPDSLQHDDLHSGNICWSGPAAATVIDWGDASWGSPVATLLCTLASLARAANVSTDSAPVLRVRDAYLEAFTTLATRAELVHLVDLAVRAGCVTRALSWRAAMRDVPASGHEEWEFPVRSWLLELLSR